MSNNNQQFQEDIYDTQFVPSDISRESDEDVRVVSNNEIFAGVRRVLRNTVNTINTRNQSRIAVTAHITQI